MSAVILVIALAPPAVVAGAIYLAAQSGKALPQQPVLPITLALSIGTAVLVLIIYVVVAHRGLKRNPLAVFDGKGRFENSNGEYTYSPSADTVALAKVYVRNDQGYGAKVYSMSVIYLTDRATTKEKRVILSMLGSYSAARKVAGRIARFTSLPFVEADRHIIHIGELELAATMTE